MDIIEDLEQGTEEWHAVRTGRITASKADAFFTDKGKLSGSKAANVALRKIVLDCFVDLPSKFSGNDATEHGHEFEPVVRDAFTAKTGKQVSEVGFCVSDQFPELGFSPDGLIYEGAEAIEGIEIKSPQLLNFVNYRIDDVLPSLYSRQVHYSLAVSGFSVWHFCVGHPITEEILHIEVERNEITETMEAALSELSARYREEKEKVRKALGI